MQEQTCKKTECKATGLKWFTTMMAGLPELRCLGSLVIYNISEPLCLQFVLRIKTTPNHYDRDYWKGVSKFVIEF
jgi:hypothetical protein